MYTYPFATITELQVVSAVSLVSKLRVSTVHLVVRQSPSTTIGVTFSTNVLNYIDGQQRFLIMIDLL